MKISRFSKYLTLIISFFIFLTLLDVLIAKSLYHPLIYPYKFLSWLISPKSTSAQTPNQQTISTRKRMVVTTQHEATKVGVQILNQGGNAIDAAVAIGYALAITDPCCGNLEGGCFMLIDLANGKDVFINFREKAPSSATTNMYLDEQGNVVSNRSRKGYLAVGVPGTVKGLDYALNQYRTLSREQAISPSIQLAELGFILTEGDLRILKLNDKKKSLQNIMLLLSS